MHLHNIASTYYISICSCFCCYFLVLLLGECAPSHVFFSDLNWATLLYNTAVINAIHTTSVISTFNILGFLWWTSKTLLLLYLNLLHAPIDDFFNKLVCLFLIKFIIINRAIIWLHHIWFLWACCILNLVLIPIIDTLSVLNVVMLSDCVFHRYQSFSGWYLLLIIKTWLFPIIELLLEILKFVTAFLFKSPDLFHFSPNLLYREI